MKTIGALLLSLLGLVGIIFNRFAVEESLRIWPALNPFLGPPSGSLGRIVVILTGTFFVLFGLLMAMGYLQ